jgi:hypothetical protein
MGDSRAGSDRFLGAHRSGANSDLVSGIRISVLMNRNYTVDLNFNFSRPLRIEVKVIVENTSKDAELARLLDSASNELKEAVENNQPETP